MQDFSRWEYKRYRVGSWVWLKLLIEINGKEMGFFSRRLMPDSGRFAVQRKRRDKEQM